jgi:signal transduction histidine kinase
MVLVGLCTHLVFEVNSVGSTPDYDHWEMVPWTRMPAAFSLLSQGTPYVFRVDDLAGEEGELYAGADTGTEVDIPIFIGDEWAGIIGLADVDPERTWTSDEIGLLRTVAEMIASSWEREFQRERLEQLVRSKDEFVASVSHELRTPLTAVLGFALELQERRGGPARTEEDELIDLIAREADDLSNLVQDLLVAARAEIDAVTCVPGVVELRGEVEAVLERLRPVPKTVEVVGAGTAWADAARLRQIVRNLFTNALRYGGARIEMHMTERDDHALLQVRDDGPGIPDHDQDRLFDAYYRGPQGATQPVSVGLGLYVSSHLASLMGGDLVYRYEDDASDMCYVRDAGRGVALVQLASDLQHGAYNIGAGRATSNREFAGAIRARFPDAHLPLKPGATAQRTDPYMDLTRIRQDAGYHPQFALDAAMHYNNAWLRTNPE